MRYVTYVLTPRQGYIDPGQAVKREYGVTAEAIHGTDFLEDGSVVQRLAVSGDPDDIQRCLTDDESILDVELVDTEETAVLQLHYVPGTLSRTLLEIGRRHPVLTDYPLEFVGPERRSLRVSFIGPEDGIEGIVTETREHADVSIEQLGSYDPSAGRRFSDLTDRQREVLRTALAAGYYEVPRRVTHEDIARTLDCATGTVGEHLQRIEAKVMSSVFNDGRVGDVSVVASRP